MVNLVSIEEYVRLLIKAKGNEEEKYLWLAAYVKYFDTRETDHYTEQALSILVEAR